MLQVGLDLIKADNFGSEKIQRRIDEIEDQWKNLMELSNYRKKRLMEAVDFYQVKLAVILSQTYMYLSTFNFPFLVNKIRSVFI